MLFLHTCHPSPLLCVARRQETSKVGTEYQADVTALLDKVKTAVQHSHLWVLLPDTPGAWAEEGSALAQGLAELGGGLPTF